MLSGHSTVSAGSKPPFSSFNEVCQLDLFSLWIGTQLGLWQICVLQLIESLIDKKDLSESESEAAMEFLLSDTNEALISAFLVLLRAKGETYEEVSKILK